MDQITLTTTIGRESPQYEEIMANLKQIAERMTIDWSDVAPYMKEVTLLQVSSRFLEIVRPVQATPDLIGADRAIGGIPFKVVPGLPMLAAGLNNSNQVVMMVLDIDGVATIALPQYGKP